jgi:hypothetical protein
LPACQLVSLPACQLASLPACTACQPGVLNKDSTVWLDGARPPPIGLMEQHVFAFSMIIEGTTEKVLQFSMLIMSIFNQNFGFNEKVCIFEHHREVQTIKKSIN